MATFQCSCFSLPFLRIQHRYIKGTLVCTLQTCFLWFWMARDGCWWWTPLILLVHFFPQTDRWVHDLLGPYSYLDPSHAKGTELVLPMGLKSGFWQVYTHSTCASLFHALLQLIGTYKLQATYQCEYRRILLIIKLPFNTKHSLDIFKRIDNSQLCSIRLCTPLKGNKRYALSMHQYIGTSRCANNNTCANKLAHCMQSVKSFKIQIIFQHTYLTYWT